MLIVIVIGDIAMNMSMRTRGSGLHWTVISALVKWAALNANMYDTYTLSDLCL